jgi:hypothetical protein
MATFPASASRVVPADQLVVHAAVSAFLGRYDTPVTTMLDAGVSLRDVQIAARHADPRTTMRYDRARKNLDRHPNYVLAAYMASGT